MNGGWDVYVPVGNLRICQEATFLNSLPSKFLLLVIIFFRMGTQNGHSAPPLESASHTLRFCMIENVVVRSLWEPFTPKNEFLEFHFLRCRFGTRGVGFNPVMVFKVSQYLWTNLVTIVGFIPSVHCSDFFYETNRLWFEIYGNR